MGGWTGLALGALAGVVLIAAFPVVIGVGVVGGGLLGAAVIGLGAASMVTGAAHLGGKIGQYVAKKFGGGGGGGGPPCSSIAVGSSKTVAQNKAVARIGDPTTHNAAPLKSGAAKVLEGGKPVSRVAESATCGASKVISGASKVIVGGPSVDSGAPNVADPDDAFFESVMEKLDTFSTWTGIAQIPMLMGAAVRTGVKVGLKKYAERAMLAPPGPAAPARLGFREAAKTAATANIATSAGRQLAVQGARDVVAAAGSRMAASGIGQAAGRVASTRAGTATVSGVSAALKEGVPASAMIAAQQYGSEPAANALVEYAGMDKDLADIVVEGTMFAGPTAFAVRGSGSMKQQRADVRTAAESASTGWGDLKTGNWREGIFGREMGGGGAGVRDGGTLREGPDGVYDVPNAGRSGDAPAGARDGGGGAAPARDVPALPRPNEAQPQGGRNAEGEPPRLPAPEARPAAPEPEILGGRSDQGEVLGGSGSPEAWERHVVRQDGFNSNNPAGKTYGEGMERALQKELADPNPKSIQERLDSIAQERAAIAREMNDPYAGEFGVKRDDLLPNGRVGAAQTPMTGKYGDTGRRIQEMMPPSEMVRTIEAPLPNGERVEMTRIFRQHTDTGGMPLMVHTPAENVPRIMDHVDRLYQDTLTRELTPAQIVERTGYIHWFLANAMPFNRGSAGIVDTAMKDLMIRRGIDPGPYKPGVTPDLIAMTTSDPWAFAKAYARMHESFKPVASKQATARAEVAAEAKPAAAAQHGEGGAKPGENCATCGDGAPGSNSLPTNPSTMLSSGSQGGAQSAWTSGAETRPSGGKKGDDYGSRYISEGDIRASSGGAMADGTPEQYRRAQAQHLSKLVHEAEIEGYMRDRGRMGEDRQFLQMARETDTGINAANPHIDPSLRDGNDYFHLRDGWTEVQIHGGTNGRFTVDLPGGGSRKMSVEELADAIRAQSPDGPIQLTSCEAGAPEVIRWSSGETMQMDSLAQRLADATGRPVLAADHRVLDVIPGSRAADIAAAPKLILGEEGASAVRRQWDEAKAKGEAAPDADPGVGAQSAAGRWQGFYPKADPYAPPSGVSRGEHRKQILEDLVADREKGPAAQRRADDSIGRTDGVEAHEVPYDPAMFGRPGEVLSSKVDPGAIEFERPAQKYEIKKSGDSGSGAGPRGEPAPDAAWFHGTPGDAVLTRLDPNFARDGNLYGPGGYLAQSRVFSEMYAQGGTVYSSVGTNFERPFNADRAFSRDEAKAYLQSVGMSPQQFRDWAGLRSKFGGDTIYKGMAEVAGGDKAKVNDALRAAGHDVIYFKDGQGNQLANSLKEVQLEVAAPSPTSARSDGPGAKPPEPVKVTALSLVGDEVAGVGKGAHAAPGQAGGGDCAVCGAHGEAKSAGGGALSDPGLTFPAGRTAAPSDIVKSTHYELKQAAAKKVEPSGGATPLALVDNWSPPAPATRLDPFAAGSDFAAKVLHGRPAQETPPGQVPAGDGRRVIGGHSPEILRDPNVRVLEKTDYPDGTAYVKFQRNLTPELDQPVWSKVKWSTVAPESWSSQKVLDAGRITAATPSISTMVDGATVHESLVDGVKWRVIIGPDGVPISSYPTPFGSEG